MKESQIFLKSSDGCDVLVRVFLRRVYGLTSLEAYKTAVMDSSFCLSSVLECKVLGRRVREGSVQLFVVGTSSVLETKQAFNEPLLKE